MPRIAIIINPVSGPIRRGRAGERVDVAVGTLRRLGVDGDVRLTERAGHAHELAEEAVAAGAGLVIAWGGDGTINEVARALIPAGASDGPETALGIVPGGSGNGLARELGIPFSPAAAIERAVRTTPRRLDAGELGERIFLNVAGIGLDAHVAAVVSTRVRHRGLLPYVTASLRDVLHYRAAQYAIELDGRTETTSALVVAFANGPQYGFGAHISPSASLSDGRLDMVLVEDRRLAGNLIRLPSLFTRGFTARDGVTLSQVTHAVVRASSPMLFHVDGEPMQGGEVLSARVLPGAILVSA